MAVSRIHTWVLSAAAVLAVGLGTSPGARADSVDAVGDFFTATLTDCNVGLCTSGNNTGHNFGTVKVTFQGGNLFQIAVSLTGPEVFAITGLTGFAFNLATGLSAP